MNKKNHDELFAKRRARDMGLDPYAPAKALPEDDARLQDISARSLTVHAAHQAYKEAIMEERDTASQLLYVGVAHLKDALPALVGQIDIERLTQISIRDGKLHSETTTLVPHGMKGVLIIDRFTVSEDTPDSGVYGGSGLYVLENGAFAVGTRSGSWSRTPGTRCELRMYMNTIAIEDVLKRYRVEDVLEGMVKSLTRQEALADAAERVRWRATVLAKALESVRLALAVDN